MRVAALCSSFLEHLGAVRILRELVMQVTRGCIFIPLLVLFAGVRGRG
jgi:hypothetical protein